MARFYWSVDPRYTPGSGAGVDLDTAARVLVQEWDAIEHTLYGLYGIEAQRDAMGDKLDGIVTAYEEPRSGLSVHYDLIRGTVERRTYTRGGQLKDVFPVDRDIAGRAIDALRDEIAANLRAQHAARATKLAANIAEDV